MRSKSFTGAKDVMLAIIFTMYLNVHTLGILQLLNSVGLYCSTSSNLDDFCGVYVGTLCRWFNVTLLKLSLPLQDLMEICVLKLFTFLL